MNSRPCFAAPALLALTVALAGCAQTPPSEDTAGGGTGERVKRPASTPEIEYDGATLGDLLVAETAAQRQNLDISLPYYTNAARTTRDPEVIGQAAQLAAYLKKHDQSREMADLWLEQDPDNASALGLAALADIQLGDSDSAAGHIDQLLAVHGSDALLPLVAETRNLQETDNQELLEALSALAERYPREAPLWYARALDRRQQGDLDGALEAVDVALDNDSEHLEARLLRGQILLERGDTRQALRQVKKTVNDHPEERRPRLAYVRVLLATGQIDQAREQLTQLAEQNPDDLDLQYSLALMALESGAADTAEPILEDLLSQGYRPNDMRLHLGQAAEQRGDADQAIDLYLSVKGADNLQAQVQAARLLYDTGRAERGHALITSLTRQYPDRANLLWISEADMRSANGDPEGGLALLDDALEADPDNPDLLYARAMTAAALERFDRMEADLKRVLEQEPDSAAALNALGYTWADQNRHLDQAHDMIQRALEQEPDDPAILDSMGWVLYRLGRPEEALDYLRRAHAAYPDGEVSAHLGEVLWVLGEKRKAREVWRQALDSDPDTAAKVRDTLQRLEVEL